VEDDKNPYKIKVNKCVQIYERLGKSSEKKNIMTECSCSTTVRFEKLITLTLVFQQRRRGFQAEGVRNGVPRTVCPNAPT
jgi:hypothetical protein